MWYRHRDADKNVASIAADLVPSAVVDIIDKDNEKFTELKIKWEYNRNMLRFGVSQSTQSQHAFMGCRHI